MLLGVDARGAHHRRHSVREKLHEWAGILVGHDSGDRPRSCRMFGRKRCAGLQELSTARVLVGPLASGSVFQGFDGDQGINGRFAAQKAGFALVLVMRR